MTSADRLLLVIALAAAASALRCDPARAQSVEAETLFREGRRLLDDGKVAEACSKFEASDRLERSTGTLLNLGDCRERQGKLASAWASFRKAEASARRDGSAKQELEAKRRAVRLEPRLSHLVLEVGADAAIAGLVISRDGEPIDPVLWNGDVPVDPGTYRIAAEAPGYRSWSTRLTISNDERRQSLAIPPLELEPVGAADRRTITAEPGAELDGRASGGRVMTTTRGLSIGVATIGLATLGVAVGVGLQARDLDAEANLRCPETACGDPEALRLNDEAHDRARLANILYGAGGAAVAVALVMWIAGGPDEPPRITVRPTYDAGAGGAVGMTLGGSF